MRRAVALVGLVLYTLSVVTSGKGARILAIFPFPGPSQYILVQPYLKTLAARGHELTVINAFPQKQPIPNFRDIVLENTMEEENIAEEMTEFFLTQNLNMWQEMAMMQEYLGPIASNVLDNAEVQQLLHSNEHFDLVIVETLMIDVLYSLGPYFGAPLIGISSFGSDRHCDQMVGNPSPPSYIPTITSKFTDRMTFGQRLVNLLQISMEWVFDRTIHLPEQQRLYNKYFPDGKLDLLEVRRNFSLLLLNQHFSLSFPRPYVPNMIEVGGFHLQHKPTALPVDMAAFLNASTNGVIYFSLGSNVKSSYLPQHMRDILLNFFAELSYGVMWKFEEPELPGKPDNVFISKWFPQPDILAHPNVKAFFTHGGLLSTIEAIYHAKPVVGMPVFYDQFLNVERAKKMGIGESVNIKELSTEALKAAFDLVMNDPSYTRRAQELSQLYHDQPMAPLDSAIYWTEYVLRYGGTPHMRVAGQELHFIQYHSIDTLLVLYGGPVSVLVIAVWLVCRLVGKMIDKKPAAHKNKKFD